VTLRFVIARAGFFRGGSNGSSKNSCADRSVGDAEIVNCTRCKKTGAKHSAHNRFFHANCLRDFEAARARILASRPKPLGSAAAR